jgi:ArsR family metal-binding transcriptional regulator
MLLDEVQLTLVNIECMPTSTKFNAIIDLQVDIGELLPYLAAEIRGCTYIHGTDQLYYMEEGHIIAIRPRQITVTALQNEQEAQQVAGNLKSLINGVYQRRDRIVPVLHKQARLDPLTVYRELPRTNCGECGEATCMAFAARVVNRELSMRRCTVLLEAENKDSRMRLEELLGQAEYEID